MRSDDRRQVFSAFSTAFTVGLNMAAAIVVGLLLGRLVDGWLGTRPWATAAGIVLGVLAGLWSAYKRIIALK